MKINDRQKYIYKLNLNGVYLKEFIELSEKNCSKVPY